MYSQTKTRKTNLFLGAILNVIPVMDLLDGQVVHAKLGDRKNYKPVISTLCKTSDPLEVLAGLLTLYRFRTCYIADLNAIQNTGSHFHLMEKIIQNYPEIQFWVDGGYHAISAVEKMSAAGARVVLGSESMSDFQHYQLLSTAARNQSILSLDFKNQDFHGPIELLVKPEAWPDNVIVMTLNQVGSNAGPALDQLKSIQATTTRSKLYAAGGVRNISDIQQLASAGIGGALVASALHSGAVSKSELKSMAC